MAGEGTGANAATRETAGPFGRVLAVDTATEACTVGLWIDGAVHVRHRVGARVHAQSVIPMIDALLAEAGLAAGDLDGLGVGRGPGSFTGIRIGLAAVQGLAFAIDRPLVGVSTLAAVALDGHRASGSPHVLAALDARMGEVYAGLYTVDTGAATWVTPGSPERVLAPEAAGSLLAPGPGPESDGVAGAGSGFASYEVALRAALGRRLTGLHAECLPHGEGVVQLAVQALAAGEGCAPWLVEPVYLRDRVAEPPSDRPRRGRR